MSGTPGMSWGVLALVAAGLAFGAVRAVAQESAGPAFEVASVKLRESGARVNRSSPGRFSGTVTVKSAIMRAYGLQLFGQVAGPKEAEIALDIDAKLPEGATQEQIPRMILTLLADRLKLKVHEEERVMPVYELIVANGGPKMKEVEPSRVIDQILRYNRTNRTGHMTMSLLAGLLSETLERNVLDFTGLKAIYDVKLQWAADVTPVPPGGAEIPAASEGPNLFQALQQQLGLKLEQARAPVKVIVIDHVERVPIEN